MFRAIAAAAGIDWDTAVAMVCATAIKTRFAPCVPQCYGKTLVDMGFEKMKQPKKPDGVSKYTGAEFCRWLNQEYPDPQTDVRIVANIGVGHAVCIKRDATGKFKLHDIWNSALKCVGSYWIRK